MRIVDSQRRDISDCHCILYKDMDLKCEDGFRNSDQRHRAGALEVLHDRFIFLWNKCMLGHKHKPWSALLPGRTSLSQSV